MNSTSERDLRLDFCRGLALIIIFVDHVPNNPFANWTLHNFAFCDAAEIFVLVSGMASYIAYGSRLDRLGFAACAKAIGRRWTKIYVAHLLLFLSISVIALFAASRFSATDYVKALNFNWLLKDPRHAVIAAVTLHYLPRFVDILPLYLVLLALAPLLIYLVKHDYRVALLVSFLIYITVYVTGFNLDAENGSRGWYFNPFAWQFLYTIGMAVYHLSRTAPDQLPWKRRWLALAIGFIIFGAITATPWQVGGMSLNAPIPLWLVDKTFLAPVRVVNVLAMLYLFAFFVPPQAAALRTWAALPFLFCGRHSLTIYSFGVVLSCIGFIWITETQDFAIVLMVNFGGIFILCGLAKLLDWYGVAVKSSMPLKSAY